MLEDLDVGLRHFSTIDTATVLGKHINNPNAALIPNFDSIECQLKICRFHTLFDPRDSLGTPTNSFASCARTLYCANLA